MPDDASTEQNTPTATPVPPLKKEWYIGRGDQSQGPYTIADVEAAIRSGEYGPTDLIWKKEWGEWKQIREVPEFAGSFRTVTAPVVQVVPRGIKTILQHPVSGVLGVYAASGAAESYSPGLTLFALYEGLIMASLILASLLYPRLRNMPARIYSMGLLAAAVLFLSLSAAVAVIRMVAKGKGKLPGDVFIAGAAFLPLTITAVLALLLGVLNIEIVVIVGVFGLCYFILILYGGLSLIYEMPEARAAVCLPAVIVVTAWICKVIVSIVLQQVVQSMGRDFDKMF